MAPYITTLNKLTVKSITQAIKVRCVHVYKTFFNGNKKDVMTMECIVHDREGVKIHLTFPGNLVTVKGAGVKEGMIYLIQNFLVKPNQMKYRTTSHKYRITIYQRTEITQINDHSFALNMLNLKKFDSVAAMEDVEDHPLFDIIGVVKDCGTVMDENNAKLLELLVEDENHNTLYCTLWEEYVDSFLSQRDHKGKKVPIVLIQFCRATVYRGAIRTCTVYNSSRVSLNKDIPEINAFRDRIIGDESFIAALPHALLLSKPKVTNEFEGGADCIKNIDELFCMEDGIYWICARIESVDCYGEWFYMSCKKCNKKVSKIRGRFFCGGCNKYEGSAVQRYMLKLEVFDGTNTAQLLLWDKESVKLIGKKAADVELKSGEVGILNAVPKEIEECVVGQIVLFKIVLRNEEDFTKSRPYNVRKVVNEAETVSKFSGNLLACLESNQKAEFEEKCFLDECQNLSQITDIGSEDCEANMLYTKTASGDYNLQEHHLGNKDCVIDLEELLSGCNSAEMQKEKIHMNRDQVIGEGTVKRKLEEKFDECDDEVKKIKLVAVKTEPED